MGRWISPNISTISIPTPHKGPKPSTVVVLVAIHLLASHGAEDALQRGPYGVISRVPEMASYGRKGEISDTTKV